MRTIFIKRAALFAALAHLAPAQAQTCLDAYQAEGSFLTGRSHRTQALLPGTSVADAFQRALQFTAQNGFTVLSSSLQQGQIEAAQSSMLASGKRMPLNITLQDEAGGTRISISLASGRLASYKEENVKNHFCKTIEAAQSAPSGAKAAIAAAPEAPSQAAAPRPNPAPRLPGLAAIKDDQKQAISLALAKGPHPERLKPATSDLMPTLSAFIERMGCIGERSAAASLDEFAAPGQTFRYSHGTFPLFKTKYHDRNQCMTVIRVHGWKMPADNAVQFEVVFKADESSETAKTRHEVVRQPDGSWLFTE